jgi:hypothetical protein
MPAHKLAQLFVSLVLTGARPSLVAGEPNRLTVERQGTTPARA